VGAIERASLVLLPILVLIVAALAIYSQTLDGAGEARAYYLGFGGESLRDPALWRAAAGQAFYSIGIGQGMLIAYGSYVPAGTNIIRSTALIAATNSGISITAGLLVLSFVFTFGLAPDEGSALAFTVFPRIFPDLPAGEFLAAAFFVLLFVAGFTSCLGMSLVVLSAVRDELRLSRQAAARLVAGGVVLLGIPSALSFTDVGLQVGGRPFLEVVDQATGSGVVVVLGFVGAALLAIRLPRRALAAAFSADEVGVGPIRLGPRSIIRWAAVLPLVAAAAYAVGLMW
jgi:neurotransmitter:Na+ symporter, NSS family